MTANEPDSPNGMPMHGARKLLSRLFLEIPLHPRSQHEAKADEIVRSSGIDLPDRVSALMGFRLYYAQILAIHFKLTRVVQNTGQKIKPMAPIAGALEWGFSPYREEATRLLAELENEMPAKDFAKIEADLRKLRSGANRTHPNCLIWIVLDEVIELQMTTSFKGEDSDKDWFPSTSDVRRFVTSKVGNPKYQCFQHLDDKGWDRLWKDSGINRISEVLDQMFEDVGIGKPSGEDMRAIRRMMAPILSLGGRGPDHHKRASMT